MPQVPPQVGKGRITHECGMQVDGQAFRQEAVGVWRINMDNLMQQGPGVLPGSTQGHLQKTSVPEIARYQGSANAVRTTDVHPNGFAPRRPPERLDLLPLLDSIATIPSAVAGVSSSPSICIP